MLLLVLMAMHFEGGMKEALVWFYLPMFRMMRV